MGHRAFDERCAPLVRHGQSVGRRVRPVERLTHSPGGITWEGVAARAAQDRAHADRRRVSAVADQLHTASSFASTAVGDFQAVQRRVLAVVDAAEAAGFTVGEDFSLTTYRAGCPKKMAAAEAEARELGRQLSDRITELNDLDHQVAKQIARVADGVGTLGFGARISRNTAHNEEIQAVDNRVLKEAPPQPPPPDPTPGPLPPRQQRRRCQESPRSSAERRQKGK